MKTINLYLILTFTLIGVTACSSNSSDFFKLTFTDELKPEGLFPMNIEIGSNGKLVALTNKFNENEEIYQRTYFIELNPYQLDSVKLLLHNLKENFQSETKDSTVKYLFKYDNFSNGKKSSKMFLMPQKSPSAIALTQYCNYLLTSNKRYLLNQSYYFSTDEICYATGY